MEACVRGFSFMPENKVDIDLQYIEGDELERTWRTTRRERQKQREQKIWDDFVKENDVVKDVFTVDPYQFLDQLPETCLQEMMEKELQKMTKEAAEEEAKAKEKAVTQEDLSSARSQLSVQPAHCDSPPAEENQHTCTVTFADDVVKDDNDMFHIFDDDQSGEDEMLNESMSPDTVRERPAPAISEFASLEQSSSTEKTSTSKSSENVTHVIESSIYCAKVRDIRMKINDEIKSMMTTLDRRDILSVDADDIGRMVKRSAEFCTRFNRIYMYQLQRQMHDIKRSNSITLPFAKHTQFQSQMVRIVSLHQNLLQAYQVFHKSLEQTCCVRDSVASLRALVGSSRDASRLCAALPAPRDFTAAADLYKDELLPTCEKFDEFVEDYGKKCQDFLHCCETMNFAYGEKKEAKLRKKRHFGPWVRNTTKTVTESDARLSMYSLDNLRLNLNAKSSSSKDTQSSLTKKARAGVHNTTSARAKRGQADKNSEVPKSQRKSPGSRRPLMRDPHAGKPKTPKPTRDTDIRTMVETVQTVSPIHCRSREQSPSPMPTRRSTKASTPRRLLHHTPRPTPKNLQHAIRKPNAIPKLETRLSSLVTVRSKARGEILSPTKPYSLRPILSSIKSDQETVECFQMTPVCKINCAMKKDREMDETEKTGECGKVEEEPKKAEQQETPEPTNRDNVQKKDRDRKERMSNHVPDRCQVTRLLKQLCSGDTSGTQRVIGAKNAQLMFVSGSSPRQPSTPQLLRILEETIQKKVPKSLFQKPASRKPDRLRFAFNISDKTADALFQYRTKFVQHMLTSPMYANSAVGKPWEVIGNVSEQIIDELLLNCVKDMELHDVVQKIYKKETQ